MKFGVYIVGVVMMATVMVGCGVTPDGGVTQRVEVVTNAAITHLTNTVLVHITNESFYMDVALTDRIVGEWLVTQDTHLDMTNSPAGDAIAFIRTNTYDSVTNSGRDGAFSFIFKSDLFVNMRVYNSLGGVLREFTNEYRYSVFSNAYGHRLEMELLFYAEETRYVLPDGPMEFLFTPIEQLIVKTNFRQNFRITNVFTHTNLTYFRVTNTNRWLGHIQRFRVVDTYVLDAPGGLTASPLNGLFWRPDTNKYQTVKEQGMRSRYSVSETLVTSYNSQTLTGTMDFNLQADRSFDLVRIH